MQEFKPIPRTEVNRLKKKKKLEKKKIFENGEVRWAKLFAFVLRKISEEKNWIRNRNSNVEKYKTRNKDKENKKQKGLWKKDLIKRQRKTVKEIGRCFERKKRKSKHKKRKIENIKQTNKKQIEKDNKHLAAFYFNYVRKLKFKINQFMLSIFRNCINYLHCFNKIIFHMTYNS